MANFLDRLVGENGIQTDNKVTVNIKLQDDFYFKAVLASIAISLSYFTVKAIFK